MPSSKILAKCTNVVTHHGTQDVIWGTWNLISGIHPYLYLACTTSQKLKGQRQTQRGKISNGKREKLIAKGKGKHQNLKGEKHTQKKGPKSRVQGHTTLCSLGGSRNATRRLIVSACRHWTTREFDLLTKALWLIDTFWICLRSCLLERIAGSRSICVAVSAVPISANRNSTSWTDNVPRQVLSSSLFSVNACIGRVGLVFLGKQADCTAQTEQPGSLDN